MIYDDEYKFKKILGAGRHGTVCLFENVNTNQEFAVKFDPLNGKAILLTECLFLKEFSD